MREEFGTHNVTKAHSKGFARNCMMSNKRLRRPNDVQKPRDPINIQVNTELKTLKMADERLAKTKAVYCEKRLLLQKDSIHVQTLVSQLREGHIAFEHFIKGNQEKRERVKKSLEGRVAMKEIEVDDLQKEIQAWEKMKKEYDKELREIKFYEYFLDKVAAASEGEFKDSGAIVKRYASLCEAKKKCEEKRQSDIEEMQKYIQNLQQKSDMYQLNIMGLRNHVGTLNRQHAAARQLAVQWENVVQSAKNTILNCQKEKQQIKDACWRLYILTCHRQNDEVNVPRPDISEQLNSIDYSLVKGAKILSQVANR